MSKNQKNFVDLFCGAGGLSRGLEMAGFQCVLGTDHNKSAMTTFERNHPDAESYLGDISDISDYKFKKIAKKQKPKKLQVRFNRLNILINLESGPNEIRTHDHRHVEAVS